MHLCCHRLLWAPCLGFLHILPAYLPYLSVAHNLILGLFPDEKCPIDCLFMLHFWIFWGYTKFMEEIKLVDGKKLQVPTSQYLHNDRSI